MRSPSHCSGGQSCTSFFLFVTLSGELPLAFEPSYVASTRASWKDADVPRFVELVRCFIDQCDEEQIRVGGKQCKRSFPFPHCRFLILVPSMHARSSPKALQ